jgi:hypothetical protein
MKHQIFPQLSCSSPTRFMSMAEATSVLSVKTLSCYSCLRVLIDGYAQEIEQMKRKS